MLGKVSPTNNSYNYGTAVYSHSSVTHICIRNRKQRFCKIFNISCVQSFLDLQRIFKRNRWILKNICSQTSSTCSVYHKFRTPTFKTSSILVNGVQRIHDFVSEVVKPGNHDCASTTASFSTAQFGSTQAH